MRIMKDYSVTGHNGVHVIVASHPLGAFQAAEPSDAREWFNHPRGHREDTDGVTTFYIGTYPICRVRMIGASQ